MPDCDRHEAASLCHYIIVRRDLSPGQVAAQVTHAAGESAALGTEGLPVPGTIAVVLSVANEQTLAVAAATLCQAGVPHAAITECDGSLQALGIAPTADRARMRRLFSQLPLYRA